MWVEPPAQAKSPSMRPVSSWASATAAATSSSIVTSATMERTVVPAAPLPPIRAAASISFCSVRPQMVTWAPSAASRSAVPRPMPLPPPVTRMEWPAMPVRVVSAISGRRRPAAQTG